MSTLSPEALDAWQNRERRMVLTTVDENNIPNAIWILCAELYQGDSFVIANNSMHKTLENIENGSKGALLYIAPEREAYQVKGTLEHHRDGPVFDNMKSWLNPNYPGRSAIRLKIEQVYYGAEQVV